jgi:hypothetical protein
MQLETAEIIDGWLNVVKRQPKEWIGLDW